MGRDPALDKVNRLIIHELQKNGRIKLTHLARKLKITPAAVKERIERLLERNVIKVSALVNCENVSSMYYPISATVGIEGDSECVSILTRKFINCPLTTSIQRVSGTHNLIITMVGRDLSCLEKRVNEHIRSEPGIKHVEVNIGKFVQPFIPIKINYPAAKDAAPCGIRKDDETKCEDCLAFVSR